MDPTNKVSPFESLDTIHLLNFVESIRENQKINAPILEGHKSTLLPQLGNIAFRVDRVLKFNPVTEHFVGDEEANRMLSRLYRKPFVIPEKV